MASSAASDSEPPEPTPVRHSQLISFAKLASVLDNPRSPNAEDRWDARRVRRLFKAAGIGGRITRRGHHHTTYRELCERLPRVAELYASRIHEDDVEHL
jgi:hypothetical protein